jgi:hypothetical protein
MTSNEQDDRDRRDPSTNPAESGTPEYGQQYGQPAYGQGYGEQPASGSQYGSSPSYGAQPPYEQQPYGSPPPYGQQPYGSPYGEQQYAPSGQAPAQYGQYGQQPAPYGSYGYPAQSGGYGQYGQSAVPAKPAAVTIAAVLGFIFAAFGALGTLGTFFAGALFGGAGADVGGELGTGMGVAAGFVIFIAVLALAWTVVMIWGSIRALTGRSRVLLIVGGSIALTFTALVLVAGLASISDVGGGAVLLYLLFFLAALAIVVLLSIRSSAGYFAAHRARRSGR